MSNELTAQHGPKITSLAAAYLKLMGRPDEGVRACDVKKGAFAFGSVVENGDGERFFLKMQPDDSEFVRIGLFIPHCMQIRGVYRVESGEVKECGRGEDMKDAFLIEDALPANSLQMLDVLKGKGLNTAQTTSSVTSISDEGLCGLYGANMQALAKIHGVKQYTPTHEAEGLYSEALHDVILNSKRLQGIADIYFTHLYRPEVNLLKRDNYHLLEKRMLELARRNMPYSDRLTLVHGDSWAANTFIVPHSEHVVDILYIDPAILFSDPALDVVFAAFDIAALYGHSGKEEDKKYLTMADAVVDHYIHISGDKQLRQHMALFYAYKAFVSAVFDIQNNPKRQKDVFDSGLGAVQIALSQPQHEFRFIQTDMYEAFGKR